MSFVDGIYRFTLYINDANRNLYDEIELRTPKHPYEPEEHLIARVLACAHQYEAGLEFSEGYFKPEQPSLWKRSIIDTLEVWIDVGLPDQKKLKKALRAGDKQTRYAVYFYDDHHIDTMAHHLKGSKTNWIDPIDFYSISPAILERLEGQLAIRNEWTVTLVDSSLYVECGDFDMTGSISPVNMWDAYQNVIANNG